MGPPQIMQRLSVMPLRLRLSSRRHSTLQKRILPSNVRKTLPQQGHVFSILTAPRLARCLHVEPQYICALP